MHAARVKRHFVLEDSTYRAIQMAMRTHSEIVRDYGAARLARRLAELGVDVHASTPQRWADRDSIPGEYWKLLADADIATLDELASARAAA